MNRWRPPILIGWAALSISVIIPLIVSLAAWAQTRDLHCTDDFSTTFAPLLVTCGTRGPGVLAFGWTMTLATIGGLLLATAMAIVAVVQAATRRVSKGVRAEAWILATTVATVMLAVVTAIAANPDEVATSAWIFYASTAAALILIVAAVTQALVKRAIRTRMSKGVNHT